MNGNGNSGIFQLIVIVIIGIAALYLWKKYGSGILAPAAPAPAAPAPTNGDATGISPDLTCPAGDECTEDDQGRYDCDQSRSDAYEATWCGSFSGDDLTIKLYGPPHHSDGDCCWCVLHIKPDSGQFVGGGEGPHPSSNCEDKGEGESIGSTSDVCIKAVIQPGPHVTGYAVVDGAWKQMIDYTGDCGCSETSSTKTGDQITFRCDGNFQTTCATVKDLGGGGGTTTPPPPANGDGEGADGDGEEEPADGEDEEANYARALLATRRRDYYDFGFNSRRSVKLGNFS